MLFLSFYGFFQRKTDQIYYHAGLYKDTAESYEALYPYLNDQIRFLFEYAQCLSKSDQPEKSNAVLLHATQISCDPMLYNIMGKNYQAMKQYKQAETVFIKVTHMVPSPALIPRYWGLESRPFLAPLPPRFRAILVPPYSHCTIVRVFFRNLVKPFN